MNKEMEVAVYLGKNINTKDPPHIQAEGNEALVGGRTTDEEEGHWVSLKYEGNGKFVISPLDDETNIVQSWRTPEQIRRAVQRIESPDLSKVHPRRTKKDPITITNFIDHKNSIELIVKASPENWKRLDQLLSENPEEFGKDFYEKFIRIAFYKEILPPKPRGRPKDATALVQELRYYSGELYQFVSYWLKRPKEDWPDYLTRLVEVIEKGGYKIHITTRSGRYGAKELTMYIMEGLYTKTAKRYGIKPFDDPNNFYITYIYGSGILRYYRTDFKRTFGKRFEDMPSEIIARIGLFISPLQKVLRKFRIS